MNRAAIFDALYQRLSTIEGIADASKRLALFSNVAPSQQPHMAFEAAEHTAITEPGKPARWALRWNVYVLVHDEGADGPTPLLLTLVDRIEAALQAQPGEQVKSGTATTLGNTVIAARIAGAIQFDVDPGSHGQQGGAVVPVEVIAL